MQVLTPDLPFDLAFDSVREVPFPHPEFPVQPPHASCCPVGPH